MKESKLYLEALLATVLVFVVMGALALMPWNIKALNPLKEIVKDFRYTDLYYSQLRGKPGSVDTAIVLVNIGSADRATMAGLLEVLNGYAPAAIGLDVYFPELKSPQEDSLLAAALQLNRDRLVAGNYLWEQPLEAPQVLGSASLFSLPQSGYLNLVGEDSLNTTIRHFRPFIRHGESEYTSWATRLAAAVDPQAVEALKKRERSIELIHYSGDWERFVHYEADEILAGGVAKNALANKIVLLGYLGEQVGEKRVMEDLHFTPLNPEQLGRSKPDMYGMVIQANIISMILRGDYINEMPFWLELLLAFAICYLHTLLFVYFFVKQHLWYHPVAKLVQLLTSIFLVYAMVVFYANANYSINTTLMVLAVLLSVDVLYLYETLAAYLYKKRGTHSYFIHHH
ncbi:CHASE2 domain-containing protein [Cesiribacter andamanensis]|uniref:Putative transmembrane sensor domain protein n=1 Tax=Cesiribacter andamanensis AMV16 TaxID=1279009 RepID=M7NNA9_9BACT|nr:CHASE2 domain-containing protein [Cesiribacter andamanensis]EMR03215.1 putative transmembrane sensor domain protein [Cesiribacter andamanensis AMV16]